MTSLTKWGTDRNLLKKSHGFCDCTALKIRRPTRGLIRRFEYSPPNAPQSCAAAFAER
jgi:hypothetical protein